MKKISLTLCLSFLSLFAQDASSATSNFKKGDVLVRLRGISILPHTGSSITPIGGTGKLGNSFIPELDFTYFIQDQVAAELILGTSRHSVTAKGTTLGEIDCGHLWLLPPTLTLQYHFSSEIKNAKPYLGAGLNYSYIYSTKPGSLTSTHYKNDFGFALQAGFDMPLFNSRYYLNVDVKKIFVNTKANFNSGAVLANVRVNPLVVGVGIGTRI